MGGNEGFESSDRQLRRDLGFQQLFFLSFGSIIGSGWLFATLSAGAVAGPAALLSWLIAAVLVIFIALNYAETAAMIPRSGGVVRYPHLTHGGYLGFLMSWALSGFLQAWLPFGFVLLVLGCSSRWSPCGLAYTPALPHGC